MKAYNIDTSFTGPTDIETFFLIKKILRDSTYNSYSRPLLIGHCINYITDRELLDNTVGFLKDCGFYKTLDQIEKPLGEIIQNLGYKEKDCTRIRAIVFSAVLDYEVNMRYWHDEIKSEVPKLRFDINGRSVFHNAEDILKWTKKKIVGHFVEKVVTPLSQKKQINEFKKMINTMSSIDYEKDTDSFDRDIKHLERLRDNIEDLTPRELLMVINLHPSIFEDGAFEIFKKWMEKSKDNVQDRLSFILQKLKKEKKLRQTNFNSLLKWSFENGFIDQKNFDDLYVKGYFKSPSKILTKGRIALYEAYLRKLD